MKISKEFIQAMNGVLNGEKWTRPDSNYGIHICADDDYLAMTSTVSEQEFCQLPEITIDDMTATDWEQVK